jgi:hypothetical protein
LNTKVLQVFDIFLQAGWVLEEKCRIDRYDHRKLDEFCSLLTWEVHVCDELGAMHEAVNIVWFFSVSLNIRQSGTLLSQISISLQRGYKYTTKLLSMESSYNLLV